MFIFVVNDRSRLVPPVSQDRFSNYLQPSTAITGYGELLQCGLEWAAWLLHQAVINRAHDRIGLGLRFAVLPRSSDVPNPGFVLLVLGGFLQLNMYGTEFGLRKLVAIRNVSGNKFEGKLIVSVEAEDSEQFIQ